MIERLYAPNYMLLQLDTSADGFVDWNEFATYMLLHYRENDYLRTKKEIPFVNDPKIKHVVQLNLQNFISVTMVEY